MQNLSKNTSSRLTSQNSLRHLGLCSQMATGQQTSPVVLPEKRSRGKTATHDAIPISNDDAKKAKREEHMIDIGDEQSNLLGYEVFSWKLALDKRKSNTNADIQVSTEIASQDTVDAKLTSKALVYGSQMLHLEDVISVLYCVGLRHFTVHAYPFKKGFVKRGRSRKDYHFIASNSDFALQWVNSFADQQCYVNCLPHPMASKKEGSDFIFNEFPSESYIRCKSPPKLLVILNPRSGRGRSTKVFHDMAEPIFKLAGFESEVVKTTSAGHARKLAASVDFSTCSNGIMCWR